MGLFALAVVFLKIGTLGFGGIGAALALIERELITDRRVLTPDDLTQALTYTKLLPGSTVVQVVSYVGYKIGGWRGSALATASFVFPSALAMVALGALYALAATLPDVAPTITGLVAAVVGILIATLYRLARSNVKEPLTLAIALAAFLVGALLDASAALIVVVAGLIGLVLLTAPPAGRSAIKQPERAAQ